MKGESSTSITKVELQEDGKWRTTVTFIQGRTFDGVNWEEKETSCVAFNSDKARSIAEASFVMMSYLEEHKYSLFTGELDVKNNSQ